MATRRREAKAAKRQENPWTAKLGSGELRASTVDVYLGRMEVLRKRMGAETIEEIAKRPEEYEGRLRSEVEAGERELSTVRNEVSTLLTMYKHDATLKAENEEAHARWTAYQEELKGRQEAELDENRPRTERQASSLTEIADIKARVEALRGDEARHRDKAGSMKMVMLTMYATMPPKRSDYGALRVLRGAWRPLAGGEGTKEGGGEGENYVVLPEAQEARGKEGKLVMNVYKTSDKFGRTEEALPRKVVEELEASLAAWPREYVFMGKKGEPMTNHGYTVYVQDAFEEEFGRRTGTTLLRHAFVSALKFSDTSTRERREIGVLMGHSTKTQETYKWVSMRPLVGGGQEDGKPYRCGEEGCGKAFARKEWLQEHERCVHEKGFLVCEEPECVRGASGRLEFVSEAAHERHKEWHRAGCPEQAPLKWSCAECAQEFGTHAALDAHNSDRHYVQEGLEGGGREEVRIARVLHEAGVRFKRYEMLRSLTDRKATVDFVVRGVPGCTVMLEVDEAQHTGSHAMEEVERMRWAMEEMWHKERKPVVMVRYHPGGYTIGPGVRLETAKETRESELLKVIRGAAQRAEASGRDKTIVYMYYNVKGKGGGRFVLDLHEKAQYPEEVKAMCDAPIV